MPQQIQTEIMNIVRSSYATAVGRVFMVMACAGVLFIVIALLYPRENATARDATADAMGARG
jgi:hypothetical protein